jgi:3-hydroxyacyl-[acyl-carrier-protein] dehydratase
LILVGTGLKVHRRLTRFHVLGLVGQERVFETQVSGMPIGKLADLQAR